MSIHSTGLADDEPLVVRPKVACRLLSVGETQLYELIASKELESYKDGAARKITMHSIRARVEKQLKEPDPPISDRHPAKRRQAASVAPAR
jgi:excisionase family DNA binding protein